jgi:hypothetical protein
MSGQAVGEGLSKVRHRRASSYRAFLSTDDERMLLVELNNSSSMTS